MVYRCTECSIPLCILSEHRLEASFEIHFENYFLLSTALAIWQNRKRESGMCFTKFVFVGEIIKFQFTSKNLSSRARRSRSPADFDTLYR